MVGVEAFGRCRSLPHANRVFVEAIETVVEGRIVVHIHGRVVGLRGAEGLRSEDVLGRHF